jgi:type VI secretion system protein ImpG
MDRRLLQYYERELGHVRGTAGEFAREFPKIAGRLALDEFACADPYVERLLEGFAFLAARVQLKIDAEFPRFTQGLLETVFPHYLAPTPSMAVVQFMPEMGEAGLAQGVRVPRGTALRGVYGQGTGDRTPCEYRTAHEVRLYPIQVVEAKYFAREMGVLDIPSGATAGRGAIKSAIRVTLESSSAVPFGKMDLPALTMFLRGNGSHPMRILERLLGHCKGVVLRPASSGSRERAEAGWSVIEPGSLSRVGFDESQSLLPYDARSFQGYRLLAEYFSFSTRFMFIEVGDLARCVAGMKSNRLEMIFLLDDDEVELEGEVEASNFGLHCTPAVNLFPKRADRILVTQRTSEFHVIVDRTRPTDFEVYSVTGVTGFGSRAGEERIFKPLFSVSAQDEQGAGGPGGGAYYIANRVPRTLSEREREQGRRSSYAGSEVFLSIVDGSAVPYSVEMKQLGVEVMCTNRDLPLQMPLGKGRTDFTLEVGVPITGVRVVAGPTRPRPSVAEGETAWRLISHQSLNYLSLLDADERGGAAALRDLLGLYADMSDPVLRKQVDAVRNVTAEAVMRRVPTPGPISFARGLGITVNMEERGFEGTGVFVLGAVLEQFFARYVGLNGFTETTIRTVERGEVMRWPVRLGRRPMV